MFIYSYYNTLIQPKIGLNPDGRLDKLFVGLIKIGLAHESRFEPSLRYKIENWERLSYINVDAYHKLKGRV